VSEAPGVGEDALEANAVEGDGIRRLVISLSKSGQEGHGSLSRNERIAVHFRHYHAF
jgi:hypothetical protein